jgi:hypothetical protein
MNPKRQVFQDNVISTIEKMVPGGGNKAFYQAFFDSMDDAAFHQWALKLKDGTARLSAFCPNFGKGKMTIKGNLALMRSLGFEPYQRLWIPAEGGTREYLSQPYLIGYAPVTRQAQFLSKKISIPKNKSRVDEVTGQPTGESKGSKISAPENQLLEAMGLTSTLMEVNKGRGGDEGMYRAMNTYASKTGEVSLQSTLPYATGVKSTKALDHYLKGAMIGSTLTYK